MAGTSLEGMILQTLFSARNLGRCYNYNFLQFSRIFGEKMALFLQTNAMMQILRKLAVFIFEHQFFANIFQK
jgi:hypothetical protein